MPPKSSQQPLPPTKERLLIDDSDINHGPSISQRKSSTTHHNNHNVNSNRYSNTNHFGNLNSEFSGGSVNLSLNSGNTGSTRTGGNSNQNFSGNNSTNDDDMIALFDDDQHEHSQVSNVSGSRVSRASGISQQSGQSLVSHSNQTIHSVGTIVSQTDQGSIVSGVSAGSSGTLVSTSSTKSDGRSNAIKHFFGNAVKYGDTEETAKTYILLKNVYTVKYDVATHRILGRLETDEKTKSQRGIAWIDVRRNGGEGKYFKKCQDKIPVLLAHLANERQFRTAFEAAVRQIFPTQYKPPKRKQGDNSWEEDDLMGSGGRGSERDSEGSAEFSHSHSNRFPSNIANIVGNNKEMGIIFEMGRFVLAGSSDEGPTGSSGSGISNLYGTKQNPVKNLASIRFIPVNNNVTELSLTKKWAKAVRDRLNHIEKLAIIGYQKSANNIIVEKFLKVRRHIDYQFEELEGDDQFTEVIEEFFPTQTLVQQDQKWDQARREGRDKNAPLWKRQLAALEDLENGISPKPSKSTSNHNRDTSIGGGLTRENSSVNEYTTGSGIYPIEDTENRSTVGSTRNSSVYSDIKSSGKVGKGKGKKGSSSGSTKGNTVKGKDGSKYYKGTPVESVHNAYPPSSSSSSVTGHINSEYPSATESTITSDYSDALLKGGKGKGKGISNKKGGKSNSVVSVTVGTGVGGGLFSSMKRTGTTAVTATVAKDNHNDNIINDADDDLLADVKLDVLPPSKKSKLASKAGTGREILSISGLMKP